MINDAWVENSIWNRSHCRTSSYHTYKKTIQKSQDQNSTFILSQKTLCMHVCIYAHQCTDIYVVTLFMLPKIEKTALGKAMVPRVHGLCKGVDQRLETPPELHPRSCARIMSATINASDAMPRERSEDTNQLRSTGAEHGVPYNER